MVHDPKMREGSILRIDTEELKRQIIAVQKSKLLNLYNACKLVGTTQPTYNNALRRGYVAIKVLEKIRNKSQDKKDKAYKLMDVDKIMNVDNQ